MFLNSAHHTEQAASWTAALGVAVKTKMAGDSFDALMKVVVIGDSSVGKTCLVLRYTQDIFRENFLSTIGALKVGVARAVIDAVR